MKHQDQTERDRQARDIFLRASEIHSPEAQAAYLEGACQRDTSLRSRVEALLDNHRQDSFLENSAVDPTQTLAMESPLTEGPGTKIGRYKLLQKIGEGGMGVVYMAEQEEPVRRRVALKIIKLGMDTRRVVARFEAERQALAMMDHPNIARVLDGGTTETGRPYFVMELVQGVPIIEFCDKSKVPARERLKLFIQVCQAVQSAHQKGVIHRDLKPSNILVTLHHGEPMAKVIDFGIAKATNQKLTEKTLFTNYATMIGTPAYMSPEQAEMTSMDVDTRTDIYSLGVLLYELLTGSTPFPEKRLRSMGYGEMQRVIADEEPERPSTRLSTLAEEQKSAVAKNCGEDLAALNTLLRGDLDWIVMKCLEKDRTRRYETANGLAADLKRHLDNEPVVARPPSAAYKFQKAWRRNKLVFAAGTAVALALVVGVIGTTAGLLRAERQRQAAQAAQQEESRQRGIAEKALEGKRQQSEAAEVARRNFQAEAYAADINLAERALSENNLGHARQLLARHRPIPGQADMRGWEWRYLWQQCRGDSPIKVFTDTNGFASLDLSHNGRWLSVMTAFGDTIRVLDFADPDAPRIVTDVTAGPMNLRQAFSPVEPLLAYAVSEVRFSTNTCKVHLRNVQAHTNVATLPLTGPCGGLKFSRDGERLVTLTSQENDARSELTVWNIRTGAVVSRHPAFSDFQDPASRFDTNPDLSLAAYCGSSDVLRVVDVARGINVWTNAAGAGTNFWATAISPDGRVLVGVAGPKNQIGEIVLHRWELATGRPIGEPLRAQIPTIDVLRFLPDGKTLVTAGADHPIRLWDLSDAQTIRARGAPWLGSESGVMSIATPSDGKTLLTGSADGAVLRWDVGAERREPTQGILKDVRQWWWGPDGRSVFAVERTNQVVQRYGPRFERKTDLLELPKDKLGLPYISSDCRFLVTSSTNGVLNLWDLQDSKLIRSFGSYHSGVAVEAFLPKRKKLIVREFASQRLEEWDLETFQMTRVWASGGGHNVCVSRDEKWLLKTEYMGRFSLVDLATRKETSLQVRMGQVTSARFSGDGHRFAASSYLGYSAVWETVTLRQCGTFGSRGTPMVVHDLSPDGTRLVTRDGVSQGLQLWDVETQRPLITFPEGRGGGFSADGNVIGFWAGGGTVHFLRPPSLAEIDATDANVTAESRKP